MAVVTQPCGEFRCSKYIGCKGRTPQNGWSIKSTCDFIKTQLCTIALTLTLFSSVHLPREAFYYGAVPYLVVYTFWLLAVGLPITLLQLAMGQLSQQDPVGVWRAVPILRGAGHLKLLTSYLCCIYYMLYVSLSAAYLIWIGKGTFPLKDCTKLFITPNGYENRMNASECFNSTFLAPFTEYPQYLGIMTILVFFLWFFVPILLYRLRKTLKASLSILAPTVVVIAVLLSSFLSRSGVLNSMFESCEEWSPLSQPYVWHSALVQALLSTQIVSGYLISAGGTVYRHSDVRWTSAFLIMSNIFGGWLWVLMWESISSEGAQDTSFISILVLIYQSSVTEKRAKVWPLLALALVLLSGIISVGLQLLDPAYSNPAGSSAFLKMLDPAYRAASSDADPQTYQFLLFSFETLKTLLKRVNKQNIVKPVQEDIMELEEDGLDDDAEPVEMTLEQELEMELKREENFNKQKPRCQLNYEKFLKKEMSVYETDEGVRGEYLSMVYEYLMTLKLTSVEAERAFSAAGYICSSVRSRLGDKTLTFLFPIFDKLQRLTGDHWRLFATALSAAGTALTVGVLARGLEVVVVLDELVVPLLTVFTAFVEVVGFAFIYGWSYLAVDIEFLTGVKLPCFWISTWWSTPVLLVGATAWWLRSLLKVAGGPEIMWTLIGVAAVIAFLMALMAIIAAVKEEQYNLWAKIRSAFNPARLWGPEEPLARYIWMSQRYHNEVLSSDNDTTSELKNYPTIYNIDLEKKYAEDWNTNVYQRTVPYGYKNDFIDKDERLNIGKPIYANTLHRGKKIENTEKFRSPNICLARDKLGGPLSCNCNRHFTLNVPNINSNETTTSL